MLRERYLRRDEHGEVVETPDELFHRVAAHLAGVEARYDGDVEGTTDRFYETMRSLDFLPNSPTLMNAGTELGQLAACFVLPIEDSLASIFDAVKHAALIHQSGGGTGFSFSALRPQGDVVQATGGVATGPVSFMRVFDAATEEIKQGGRRRGANMGVLAVDHPDVEAFVTEKGDRDTLRNFNLSVGTTAAFWEAHDAGEPFDLVNPRTGERAGQIDPRELLDTIAKMAWAVGDPGVLFMDTINRANPTPALGRIEATNPCGETPLLPYEACILGSVNLANHTDGTDVEWEHLRETVRTGVRLLDDAVDASTFPLRAVERAVRLTRKIGLGVMGLHDMLVDLKVPYGSEEAVAFAEELMAVIDEEARDASRTLVEERGAFPAWTDSVYETPVRNATRTTIAPTGTISLLAGCSSGIEPIYSVAYTKGVLGGLEIVNDRFLALADEMGYDGEALAEQLHERTSIQDVATLPEELRMLFRTAHDVPPEGHVAMQTAFQAHVDNAVSKTVNLPYSSTVDDVRAVFLMAREAGVKGITVFRSGALPEQVLGEDPLKEECVRECEYVAPSDG